MSRNVSVNFKHHARYHARINRRRDISSHLRSFLRSAQQRKRSCIPVYRLESGAAARRYAASFELSFSIYEVYSECCSEIEDSAWPALEKISRSYDGSRPVRRKIQRQAVPVSKHSAVKHQHPVTHGLELLDMVRSKTSGTAENHQLRTVFGNKRGYILEHSLALVTECLSERDAVSP